MKLPRIGILLSSLALISLGCAHAAPREGHHPAYLHALEDLRHARAHLERPAAATMRRAWDESIAIHEIDEAIREIKDAAIDDGKNIAEHEPVDARMDWPGRMHRAVELLRKARQDCEHEEDNAEVRGLRDRAIHHIDAAIHHTELGIENI